MKRVFPSKPKNGPGGRPAKRYVPSSGPRSFNKPGKFGAKPAFGAKPSFGSKPSFGGKTPMRKFGSSSYTGAAKPFSKDTPSTGARPVRKFGSSSYSGAAKPSFGNKPSFGSKPSFGAKPYGAKPYGAKPTFGAKPSFGSKPAFGARPVRKFGTGAARPSYGAPRPSYGAARPAYGAPRPAYGAKPVFGTPRPSPAARRDVPGAFGKPRVARIVPDINAFGGTADMPSMVPGKVMPKAAPKAVAPTSWGGQAEWYDDMLSGDDTFQSKVILPHLKRLMAPKEGEKIADIACGQGFFSFGLAENDVTVHGADVAPELIKIADKKREENETKLVRFSTAASDKLADFEDGAYAQAMIVLAAQNIDDMPATFGECARILEKGGRLHLVINHPSFRIPKASSWGWDPAAGVQFRRIDRYLAEFNSKIAMHPGKDPKATTVSFHRPLQYFVKSLSRKGFAVTNLEEWASHKTSDSGPRATAENASRNEIPMFMYIEAKKI